MVRVFIRSPGCDRAAKAQFPFADVTSRSRSGSEKAKKSALMLNQSVRAMPFCRRFVERQR
jgi:hypothetical protein